MNLIPNDPIPTPETPGPPPGATRTMPEILRDLAIVRSAKAPVQDELDAISVKETALRDELFNGMRANGVYTGKGSGLVASIVTKKTALVVNEDQLLDAITRAGVLDEFTRVDRSGAAKYALKNGLPGVMADELQYLRVEAAKP